MYKGTLTQAVRSVSHTLSGLLTVALLVGVAEATLNPRAEEKSLSSPGVIKLEVLTPPLRSYEDPKTTEKPYKVGDKIFFRIQATNTSYSTVSILIIDPYYQNRPNLTRGGDTVPYRDEVTSLVEAKEKQFSSRHNYYVNLEPNIPKQIGLMKLDEWYSPLRPGHYNLSLQHRFERGGPWVDSVNSVTFEVEAKAK